MVPIIRYAWHSAIVIIESYKKAFTISKNNYLSKTSTIGTVFSIPFKVVYL